jgi:hypothetical protein
VFHPIAIGFEFANRKPLEREALWLYCYLDVASRSKTEFGFPPWLSVAILTKNKRFEVLFYVDILSDSAVLFVDHDNRFFGTFCQSSQAKDRGDYLGLVNPGEPFLDLKIIFERRNDLTCRKYMNSINPGEIG